MKLMNGENLVYDYRFNVVESPTDWAFNWDYAECGTSQPTPRNHHATMWLIVNLDNPLTALQSLFKQLSKKGKYPMVLKLVRSRIEEDEDLGEYYYLFRVIHKSTKETLFEGRMEKPKEEGNMNDPNVGHFTLFSSRTKKGTEVMKYIADNTSFGHCAFIPHEKTVLSKLTMMIIHMRWLPSQERDLKIYHGHQTLLEHASICSGTKRKWRDVTCPTEMDLMIHRQDPHSK